jgi:hypothetical protein
MRLKLKHDGRLSSFDFKSNCRRYSPAKRTGHRLHRDDSRHDPWAPAVDSYQAWAHTHPLVSATCAVFVNEIGHHLAYPTKYTHLRRKWTSVSPSYQATGDTAGPSGRSSGGASSPSNWRHDTRLPPQHKQPQQRQQGGMGKLRAHSQPSQQQQQGTQRAKSQPQQQQQQRHGLPLVHFLSRPEPLFVTRTRQVT